MITFYYYTATFALTCVLLLIYMILWQKNFDVNITVIFILISITNLAYMEIYTHPSYDTLMACQKVMYVGGCFLPWLINMCVANLCKIRIRPWFRILTLLLAVTMYVGVLSIGHAPWFYKKFHIDVLGDQCVITKEYGPWHTAFYFVLGFFFLLSILFIIYSFFRKNEVPRSILLLLFIPEALSIVGFFRESSGPRKHRAASSDLCLHTGGLPHHRPSDVDL